MNTYTWSAKDRFGQSVIKEVEANSSQEAKDILLAEGFFELELKEDEVGSIARKGFAKDLQFLGETITVTAADRVRGQASPAVTLWGVLKQHISRSAAMFIVLILLAIYQGIRGHYVSVALLVIAMILWLVFLICMGLPSVYYRKLVDAADWKRWDEVGSLINALKIIGRISFVKIPASELTRYRAKAFVGNGDLEKGLAEYRQCEGRPDCPSWMYKLFVAGLYTLAKQYDKAIEYNRLSLAENPSSTGWSDLAYRYARYKRDPVKAREALTEANKSPMTDISKQFRMRSAGVIAYLESDFTTAKKELENVIAIVEPVKWRPYKDGHLAIARAYLCCVLAKQGDMVGAKNNLALAQAYLVATKEDELLAECRKQVGN